MLLKEVVDKDNVRVEIYENHRIEFLGWHISIRTTVKHLDETFSVDKICDRRWGENKELDELHLHDVLDKTMAAFKELGAKDSKKWWEG
jgi:hypothetical protein